MNERFVVRVPWGIFGPEGQWRHNPLLPLSKEQQHAANVANGHLKKPS
jgi:hypothetical protein